MAGSLEDVDEALLARAPVWVFLAVAGADNKIDRKERKKLESLLGRGDAFATDWMRAALAGSAEKLDALLAELEPRRARATEELSALALLAETHLSEAEARAFKHDLLALAKTVALASGGVLGFGEKIDADEAEVIGHIAAALRYAL